MQNAPDLQVTVPADLFRSPGSEITHADQPIGLKARDDGAQMPVARGK